MKNIFRIVMAVAILFTASCAKEDISSTIGGGEVEVTFTANLADMGTRLYGDGSKADVVYVGVYEAGQKTPLQLVNYTEGYPVVGKTATITVVLLKDKVYDLVFWAQNKAQGCYGRNWEDRSITVNYNGALSQDETRDAFFLVQNGFRAGHDETVFELRRPFAQLRAGISQADYEYVLANGSAGIANSTAVVKGVANVLSLNDETAEVYGDVTATFGEAAVAAGDDETFTVNGADYYQLSMNYLLVREKTLVDVTYTFADDNTNYTRPYYNVPVQRNYRTNIIGQLISSPMDFTVIIKPEFEGEHTVEVWDGESVSKPAFDDATQTYSIVKPSELAWIAKTVNAGVTRATENDNMRGKTIKLTSDIDLGGHEWLPIGYITGPAKGDYEGYPIAFKGTFDGQGHTVKGLYVRENKYAGLFGCLCGATIKNVNIVGAELISNHYAGAIAAWNESVKTVIENCNVSNAVITLTAEPVADGWDNGDKAGAIIGFLHGGKVNGCSAKDVTVTAYRDLGGIVGYAQSNATVSNNSVLENVKLVVDNSHNYKNYTQFDEYSVNSIVGDPVSVTLEGNTGEATIRMVIADGVTTDKAGVNYISSTEGLIAVAQEIEAGNIPLDATIELCEDIDLSALTRTVESNWTPIGTEDNPFTGTFDGRGRSIKNLALVEAEAKEGKAFIGFFGYAKNATIKNVTFENVYINIPCLDIDHSQGHIGAVAGSLEGNSTIENVTVKGDIQVYATQNANGASRVAVVAGGNSYGNVTMKNVHVVANDGSYLIANNNTGALAGQLQGKMVFENCSSNIDVTVNKFFAGGLVGIAAGDSYFKNCHTTGDVAVVAGREGRHNDEYRVGGIAGGWADGKTKVCTLENCSYTGNVSGKNADGAVAEPLDYMGYVGRGYTLANCAGSKVVIDGTEYVQKYDNVYGIYTINGLTPVATADELIAALEANEGVLFMNDIKIEPASMSNAYGATGINVKNGQTIDGNGYTLNIKGAGGTWDSGINTTGGIIKNLTVTGSFRGIFINHTSDHSEKVVLENVTIGGNGTVYTISCDQGLYQTIEATNCTFNGWTSFAKTAGEAKFTNCYFGEGSGYKYCRPYSNTEFVNCTFCPGYAVDTTRAKVTFTSCTWEE